MISTECIKCGVAYDMGRHYCVELGCGVRLDNTITESKSNIVTKKVYARINKPVDPIYSRLMSTRRRSKKRGWEHDLTEDFIKDLLDGCCVYCGSTMFIQIDRKDNMVGYVQSNVVPACKRCNTVKSMYLTYHQMMIVAKALGWNQNSNDDTNQE